MTHPELDQLRELIDRLDKQLVGLLATRFELTDQVGRFKRRHGFPPSDPAREAAQMARIRGLAEAAGLDPDFAQGILRAVIDRTVENHRRVPVAAPEDYA